MAIRTDVRLGVRFEVREEVPTPDASRLITALDWDGIDNKPYTPKGSRPQWPENAKNNPYKGVGSFDLID